MIVFYIFQILFFACFCQGNEILRLRGVAISKLVLYDASKDFTCFDGAFTIPFKYVNDDYCDCNDGSDEPGTAACPRGWFHCTNAGHQPLNIPSSRVGDGICDCCDGTDEYMNNNCSDFCHVLGEEARVAAQKRAELIKTGCELREQLSWKGKKMKEEKKERIASLERDKSEAEAIKLEKETKKKSLETAETAVLEVYRIIEDTKKAEQAEEQKKQDEQEAFDAFSLIDSNNDEKLQIDEIKVRQTFDQNKDGVVSDDEIKFFIGDAQELSWDEFLNSGWQRMKPFLMLEKGIFQPPSSEPELQHVELNEEATTPHSVERGQEEEWDGEEEEEEPLEEADGDGEEERDKDEETEKDKEGEQEDTEHEGKTKYDEETQKIIDEANKARSDFENAERTVRDLDREMKQLQEAVNKDYGHEDEFGPLDGECFEYTDREYTYKLCPFDQISQRPKSGGSDTRLGTWKGWVGHDNPYSTMLYDHGQSCWNGPQRATHVQVSCGLENAVTYAAEPNRCEYVLHFSTPSACWPEVHQDSVPHDEL